MLIDLNRLDQDTTCDVDVCIVGSGPAGITLAIELTTQGLSCALLESGGLHVDNAASRELNQGRTEGHPTWPLTASRVRCLGGTSARWHGWCRPLEPGDFTTRPWNDAPGWPLGFEHLKPWYHQAQLVCHAGEFHYDQLEVWARDAQVSLLPLRTDEISQRLYMFSPVQNFATNYAEALARSSLRCFLDATVTRLSSSPGSDQVDEVEASSRSNRRLRVRARAYVLATGGIENARLLLAARARGLPWGGMCVGHFVDHPHVLAGVLVASGPIDLRAYDCATLAASGLGRVGFAIAEETARKLRLPGASAILQPVAVDDGSLAWAILTRSEQVPTVASHVALGPELDRFGTPLPTVSWQLSRIDKLAVTTLLDLLAVEFRAARIGEVVKLLSSGDDRWPPDLVGGCHHIGTTRIADDASDGVVDSNCRVFGTRNLYMAGSSVFATAGVANPTLTIVALALRLADHLSAALGGSRRHVDWHQTNIADQPGDIVNDDVVNDETESFLRQMSIDLKQRVRSIVARHRSG